MPADGLTARTAVYLIFAGRASPKKHKKCLGKIDCPNRTRGDGLFERPACLIKLHSARAHCHAWHLHWTPLPSLLWNTLVGTKGRRDCGDAVSVISNTDLLTRAPVWESPGCCAQVECRPLTAVCLSACDGKGIVTLGGGGVKLWFYGSVPVY